MIGIVQYQNYHKHTYYTNPLISDSTASNLDYANRAIELGQGVLSIMEHGWQGRYIEGFEYSRMKDKPRLKFVMGAEAYWVKDRFEKDKSNCHIYIGAKNENGRQAINDILAEANITGFYGRPRIDIPLILSLPPKDVIVTTACIAYWKYSDVDQITEQFLEHFGDNMFLEVQYHNTDAQKILNTDILKLANRTGAKLIMGCDSHYILQKDSRERDMYIKSKGIEYPDENGWYLDYPSGETAYQRFVDQGILTKEQIGQAMDDTNVFLDVEEYDSPCFTTDVKMPTLYPELSQKEKNEKYSTLIWSQWEKEKKNVPEELWPEYEEQIRYEESIVYKTLHADYFMLDHEIVKQAIEDGGVITATGRGSAPSFYTNKLLGLTEVDRISAAVKMFPERFMSAERILEAKTLADIDINVSNQEIFQNAQKKILGDDHSYMMIAYGTLKPKAAWKMYARSQDVDFGVANEVSAQLEKYEAELKHADEDDKKNIFAVDYVDDEFKELYEKSEIYLGVVSDFKPHPCANLIWQGDIRKEIGLIRIKDKLCCVMDGKWAGDYHFLKNDLLKVSVVDIIARVFKRIGIPRIKVQDLLNLCPEGDPVWDIYKKGCTLGINQVEQKSTAKRVSNYAPKNISELSAFVAAIRPGFKSMYKIFEQREHFDYGIKALDDLIQTKYMDSSFILYQEMSMAVIHYAGIEMSNCYEIVKYISKKKADKIALYKDKIIDGLTNAIMRDEGKDEADARETAHMVWQIIEDSSRYSFNASHAYCVAIDSLYGAYLKYHYPFEFYETFLRVLDEDGDKERLSLVKQEAKRFFKIEFPPMKFGQDNRNVVADKENSLITSSLSTIKFLNSTVASELYDLASLHNYKSFSDLLFDMVETSIDSQQLEILIRIGYFSKFGNTRQLLRITEFFNDMKKGQAKSINAEKLETNVFAEVIKKYSSNVGKNGNILKTYRVSDCKAIIKEAERMILDSDMEDLPYSELIKAQQDYLGYVALQTNHEQDRKSLFVKDVYPVKRKSDGKKFGYSIVTQSIGSGIEGRFTVLNGLYDKDPINPGDVIRCLDYERNGRYFKMKAYNHLA